MYEQQIDITEIKISKKLQNRFFKIKQAPGQDGLAQLENDIKRNWGIVDDSEQKRQQIAKLHDQAPSYVTGRMIHQLMMESLESTYGSIFEGTEAAVENFNVSEKPDFKPNFDLFDVFSLSEKLLETRNDYVYEIKDNKINLHTRLPLLNTILMYRKEITSTTTLNMTIYGHFDADIDSDTMSLRSVKCVSNNESDIYLVRELLEGKGGELSDKAKQSSYYKDLSEQYLVIQALIKKRQAWRKINAAYWELNTLLEYYKDELHFHVREGTVGQDLLVFKEDSITSYNSVETARNLKKADTSRNKYFQQAYICAEKIVAIDALMGTLREGSDDPHERIQSYLSESKEHQPTINKHRDSNFGNVLTKISHIFCAILFERSVKPLKTYCHGLFRQKRGSVVLEDIEAFFNPKPKPKVDLQAEVYQAILLSGL